MFLKDLLFIFTPALNWFDMLQITFIVVSASTVMIYNGHDHSNAISTVATTVLMMVMMIYSISMIF